MGRVFVTLRFLRCSERSCRLEEDINTRLWHKVKGGAACKVCAQYLVSRMENRKMKKVFRNTSKRIKIIALHTLISHIHFIYIVIYNFYPFHIHCMISLVLFFFFSAYLYNTHWVLSHPFSFFLFLDWIDICGSKAVKIGCNPWANSARGGFEPGWVKKYLDFLVIALWTRPTLNSTHTSSTGWAVLAHLAHLN